MDVTPFVRSQAVPTKPRRAASGISQSAAEDARRHLRTVPEEDHTPPLPTQVGHIRT
jgi:hypothetical protein